MSLTSLPGSPHVAKITEAGCCVSLFPSLLPDPQAPEISQLRVSLQEVLRQRAELLVERRRQDVQDQAHECTQGNNGEDS